MKIVLFSMLIQILMLLPTTGFYHPACPVVVHSITVSISGTYNAGSMCVDAVNACGQSSNYCKVIPRLTVKPPTPASISGDIYACNGSTITYTATPSNNATSYKNWVVPTAVFIGTRNQ